MADPSVADLVRSFELHLRAENKAGRTIETYLVVLRLAARFLAARGVELEQARREDVEAFISDQLARWKPAAAANRYRSLRVFYGWLEAKARSALLVVTHWNKTGDGRGPDRISGAGPAAWARVICSIAVHYRQRPRPLKPRTIQTALAELEAAGLAAGSEEGNGRARYWSPAPTDDVAGGRAGTP